jgi:hypothetical protein
MRVARALTGRATSHMQIDFRQSNRLSRWRTIRALLIFAGITAFVPLQAAEMTEPQKIEALIGVVESRNDLKFIRLGSEHSSNEAAQMLRTKLAFAGSRVKTADEFIKYVATQTVSGSPYYVVYPDGRRITSAEFLRGELKRLSPTAAPVAAK